MSTWQVHPEEFLGRHPWKIRPDDFLRSKPNSEKPEEPEQTERKFSSTQVNLPGELAAKVRAMSQRIPDEDLAGDGREEESHVTVKYGLHTNDPEPVEKALWEEGPVTIKLGKTSIFPAKQEDIQAGGTDAADVVKIEIDSPDLHRLNKLIASSTPVTDTYPTYQPHVTLAYVKPGLGKKYAGLKDLEGETVVLNSVKFSGKDGTVVEIPLQGDASSSPTPESPDALKHQVEQLENGERRVVMLPPGSAIPERPNNINQLKTEQGIFFYDSDEISARDIKRAIKFDRLNEILGDKELGYGAPPKQELKGEPVAVVAEDKYGKDLQAVATDEESLPTTIAAAEQVAPKVRVETPEQALKKRVKDSKPS